MSVAKKIIKEHLVEGELKAGTEIAIKIDQTLTQDATGIMAYLQFEAIGIPKVRTKLSVSYVDHNITESGIENAKFLESFAAKYGIVYSKPGNGICHQVHLERFGKPGQSLLGSDSHTTTACGSGMLAIGAGGLDVAVAMAGQPFWLKMPEIVGVKLTGKLQPWVSAKDVILELLRRLSVKGGVGKIFEYFGDGIKTLSVPERATITNMGTELGATTSIFPSDEITKEFLESQGRGQDWIELKAANENYDEIIEINLSELEPLIAQPSSPDKVVKVKDVEGVEVSQVIIGSCTNSSYKDLAMVGAVLKDKKINDKIDFNINHGSINVLKNIEKDSYLENIKNAGANICKAACLGCIGMGQEPKPGTVSLRTFNRNFLGRSGTKDDKVWLCSPETAVAAALNGKITDPRSLGEHPKIELPKKFLVDDSGIVRPSGGGEIVRGERIKPLPLRGKLGENLAGEVLIKLDDNITTDDISPGGVRFIPLRGDIPAISQYVFHHADPDFAARAKSKQGGFILGGENYGQGSSREHAALAPMYLGVKGVIAKSFARIHKANLVNFGILPLEFVDADDYDKIEQGDELEINNVIDLLNNDNNLIVNNITKDINIEVKYELSKRFRKIIIAGGLLNFIKNA